ncbi:MAG TPA: hypothetical protein VHD63_05665 [Ktedonobacteraceae bacterium]|nr:hypothetical protein [Ktedonobacteraceae bacterium]
MHNQPDPLDVHTPVYPPDAETVPFSVNNNAGEAASAEPAPPVSQPEHALNQPGYQVENSVQTYEDRNARRAQMRAWVVSIIYFLLGVLEVILGLRFIFRLLGANEDNDFIMALYNLSHAFVGPFNNIFNDQTIGSHSVFELSTLVAMLIYALIAWGLASLVRVMLAPSYGTGRRAVRTLRWR